MYLAKGRVACVSTYQGANLYMEMPYLGFMLCRQSVRLALSTVVLTSIKLWLSLKDQNIAAPQSRPFNHKTGNLGANAGKNSLIMAR